MKRVRLLIGAIGTFGIISSAAWAPALGVMYLHEPGQSVVPAPPPEVRVVPIPVPIPPPPRPPRPWPDRRELMPAELTNLELNVEIEGLVATTSVDQAFRNPNDRRLEGTFIFPLPLNAVIRDMSLYIDGKPVKCEVVEADKARQIYEDIVRRARDPALLEYIGRDLVKLRIFPIEPNQTRRVKFQYSQTLKRDFGLTEYAFPLSAAEQPGQKIGHVTLTGWLRSDKPIATLYSPTHNVEFNRKDDTTAKFGFEAKDCVTADQLKIYYGVSDKDLGASLVAYRMKGEDGYFLLMVSPRLQIDKDKVIPKDVTFVFDTSGSMAGEKIEQARRALKYCLNTLRAEDRFNIIRFATETESFSPSLIAAGKEKITEALEFVNRFEARGGTAINDALLTALKSGAAADSKDADEGAERPHLIVFLTDGQPTVGEQQPDKIIENVMSANPRRSRVFAFGSGLDVNTRLLDQLSDQTGGVSDYVTPKEDIEVKVSNFFAKVSEPVLTDLEIDFGGAKAAQFYPQKSPDLFLGRQLTVIGRYRNAGKTTLVVTGKDRGKKQVFEYNVEFPDESTGADFLPRLWAIRRVGFLVDEIRRNGENKELKDEVIQLGRQYAIATPYTSMLVLEDEGRSATAAAPRRIHRAPGPDSPVQITGDADRSAAQRQARTALDRLDGITMNAPTAGGFDAGAVALSPPAEQALRASTGAGAVALARETRRLKEVETSDLSAAPEIRSVADRTFHLIDGVWTDSQYDGKAVVAEIEYGSKEYFDLLKKGGAIGKILALGTRVVFQIDGKWYRIIEPKQ